MTTAHSYSILSRLIPGIKREIISCPAFGVRFCSESTYYQGISIRDLVIHLNDYHEWTFDQIADYLETLPVDLTVKES